MTENPNIPRHVAVIMDGNGRWARSRGQQRLAGHMQGVDSVRKTIVRARELGVEYLTLFVFSTENKGRPTDEVSGLMELLCDSINGELDSLRENGVRVRVIGEREELSEKVRDHISKIEEGTQRCSDLNLILAINYSSRDELARAARLAAERVRAGELDPAEINAETFESLLYTADIPDPDLLIRTSGECRISNFLLWQLAYTELYFTDILWPEFDAKELDRAVEDYGRRERRFGLVVNPTKH